MTYKTPWHIINKEKPKPQENFGPKEHSEQYKISEFTISYCIKGTMIGFAVAFFYCNYYLHDWSELYILGGGVAGFALGWVVGRFFYTSKNG